VSDERRRCEINGAVGRLAKPPRTYHLSVKIGILDPIDRHSSRNSSRCANVFAMRSSDGCRSCKLPTRVDLADPFK
jgi:hypothetical protein